MYLYDFTKDTILNKYSIDPRSNCYYENSVFLYDKPQIKLSIIVPCYNSEKYLEKCIDSLVMQKTCYDYEILMINDGSTDGTLKILDAYQKKYSDIRVISQENKGFSGARNRGIRESKGQYLMFVDSDDYVSDGYINALLESAICNNADIATCGYHTFRGNTIIKTVSPCGKSDRTMLNGCFWGKVFRRELFSHIMLPEGYWYEDSILAHLIYPNIERFVSTDKCYYEYRSNPEGITLTSVGKPKALDTVYITDLMIRTAEKINKKNYMQGQQYNELLLEQFFLNERRLEKHSKECKKEVFRLQSIFYKNYKNNQPSTKGYLITYRKALLKGSYIQSRIVLKIYKIHKLINLIKSKLEGGI